MPTVQEWFREYGESHRHPTNQRIHKVCVPLIVFSIQGILWCLPIPTFSPPNPWVNMALPGTLLAMFFYARLGPGPLALMLGFYGAGLGLCYALYQYTDLPLLYLSLGIFILSWIGQFIGHKIEGKRPSFFKDLQFLLIGPLWVAHQFLGQGSSA